jgi:glutathione S-transferase
MIPVLWQIEISHYHEKARWALDYKQIPHVRRTPMPGLHGLYALALTRGKHRRLPILELDGRRIADSTAIIAALEAHQPAPPLYPADPSDRARALELEDFFDEQLGPYVRRYVWHYTLGDVDAVIDAVMPHRPAGRVRLLRAVAPVARPAIRKDYGVDEARAAGRLKKIEAAMDRVERELRPGGYLVGDRFSVADLTAAALFTPLLSPPERQYPPRTLPAPVLEVREQLSAREGGAWVAEMFAEHRGVSVELPRPAV